MLANILCWHAIFTPLSYDPEKDKTVVERIHSASHEIMDLCVELGGTLSGEHGIGIEKQEFMPKLFSDTDMKKMIMLREVFDPEYISNPNKIFPVRVCRECHREIEAEELKA